MVAGPNGKDVPDATIALGAVGGPVLNLAPEIGRWLFGAGAAPVIMAVQAAVTGVTGSSDADLQASVLADPDKAAALRIELARIAADQSGAADAQRQATLLASLSAGLSAAAGAHPALAMRGVGYGAPLVSMIVLLTFALVVFVALTRSMPQGAEPVLNVLLGTLGAMATTVVGYWVGSSAGSARKDERLADLTERG